MTQMVIDGVTFIETKEEAARLVAEGRATYPDAVFAAQRQWRVG